jgi:hypothetical protein
MSEHRPAGHGPQREDFHSHLIKSFERAGPHPAAKRVDQRKPGPPKLLRLVLIGDLGALLIIMLGSTAAGLVVGWGAVTALEAVRASLSVLFPTPIDPALYVYCGFVGAIFGMLIGATRIAPWWTSSRR